LGEDEPALEAGQRGGGEPGDVGVGSKFSGGNHRGEAGEDLIFPALETGGEHGSDVVVGFADLPEEVGDGATSTSTPALLEVDEGPPLDAGPGVEAGEEDPLGTGVPYWHQPMHSSPS